MLTLTEKFSELHDLVFWDDIIVFLKEAFKGYKTQERTTSHKHFRVYSKTGKSYLEFTPIIDDNHLPMHWECDYWRLDITVDPDIGQIHTDVDHLWCINTLSRKKREQTSERFSETKLLEDLRVKQAVWPLNKTLKTRE